MDYNLAKKLKDAGYSQEAKWGNLFYSDYSNDPNLIFIDENLEGLTWGKYVKMPTLSELIEACGDGFLQLYRHYEPVRKMDGKWVFVDWRAYPRPVTLKADGYVGYTPEEAVANLWLKLNEK